MINGESGIVNIYPERERPKYQPSLRRVVWENGAVATIYSAHKHEDKSGLRGPQHEKAWGDEPAKWQYPGNYDQLMFGLRLGENPQAVLTGTPRPIKIIKDLVKESRQPNSPTVVTYGSTYENRENLAASWFSRIINKYEGTRLGRQELEAALLSEVQGALWTIEMIQRSYSEEHAQDDDGNVNSELQQSMERIIVAVDPSVGDGTIPDVTTEQNAETGIMVCGRRNNRGHLLDDRSVYGHPTVWAQAAVDAYHEWGADYIVAEKNNGGELVRLTIQSVPGARNIPVKLVSASRGKYTRAEPIALLHERRVIDHHGVFAQLEDQLTTFIPGAKSPDRLDAYVWGFTELLTDVIQFGASVVGEVDLIASAPEQIPSGQYIDSGLVEEIRKNGLYFPT
jgi:phage terminase large subunit-like protein